MGPGMKSSTILPQTEKTWEEKSHTIDGQSAASYMSEMEEIYNT